MKQHFKYHFRNITFHDRISPKAWNEKIRRDSSKAGVGITVTRASSCEPGNSLSDRTEEEENNPEESEIEEEKVVGRDCLLSVVQQS